MATYEVILRAGTEVTVSADSFMVDEGALLFFDSADDFPCLAYAPGQWLECARAAPEPSPLLVFLDKVREKKA